MRQVEGNLCCEFQFSVSVHINRIVLFSLGVLIFVLFLFVLFFVPQLLIDNILFLRLNIAHLLLHVLFFFFFFFLFLLIVLILSIVQRRWGWCQEHLKIAEYKERKEGREQYIVVWQAFNGAIEILLHIEAFLLLLIVFGEVGFLFLLLRRGSHELLFILYLI